MTDMGTTPVEVPDSACDALHACTGRERDDVRAVAIPVVVAELRRLIAEVDHKREVTGAQRYRDGYFDGSSFVYDLLCDRADEIERARGGEDR